jgi:hypothetical protein
LQGIVGKVFENSALPLCPGEEREFFISARKYPLLQKGRDFSNRFCVSDPSFFSIETFGNLLRKNLWRNISNPYPAMKIDKSTGSVKKE